jgi:hypothetical protein
MKFLITIFFSLFSVSCLFSSVSYHDIDPDKPLFAPEGQVLRYDIDLDNDGTIDFYFKHFNMGESWNHIEAYTMVGQSGEILSNGNNVPMMVAQGEDIDGVSGSWHCTSSSSSSSAMFMESLWAGKGIGYLGLRFKIENQWHYAWVKIKVEADKSGFTIYDYAYETEPDVAIIAGDIGTSVIEDEVDANYEIIVSGNNLIINSKSVTKNQIEIYDLVGNRIVSESFSGYYFESFDLVYEVYLVVLRQAERVYIKKVIFN